MRGGFKLNYEKEMNAFLTRVPEFSPRAVVLWLRLFDFANREKWPPCVLFTDRQLAATCGLSGISAVQRARKELIESGIIHYEPSRDRRTPSRYILFKLYDDG